MCTSCAASSRADFLISFLRDVAMLSLGYSAIVHEAAAVVVAAARWGCVSVYYHRRIPDCIAVAYLMAQGFSTY
jgi:hypothetical protein